MALLAAAGVSASKKKEPSSDKQKALDHFNSLFKTTTYQHLKALRLKELRKPVEKHVQDIINKTKRAGLVIPTFEDGDWRMDHISAMGDWADKEGFVKYGNRIGWVLTDADLLADLEKQYLFQPQSKGHKEIVLSWKTLELRVYENKKDSFYLYGTQFWSCSSCAKTGFITPHQIRQYRQGMFQGFGSSLRHYKGVEHDKTFIPYGKDRATIHKCKDYLLAKKGDDAKALKRFNSCEDCRRTNKRNNGTFNEDYESSHDSVGSLVKEGKRRRARAAELARAAGRRKLAEERPIHRLLREIERASAQI